MCESGRDKPGHDGGMDVKGYDGPLRVRDRLPQEPGPGLGAGHQE